MDDFELNPDFFKPPAFRPDEALQRLRRELRALGLNEREGRFERQGQALLKGVAVSPDGAALTLALARRLARSPEWQPRSLRDSAQLRDLLAEVKKRLSAAADEE